LWGWDEKTQDSLGGKESDGNRWNNCHYTTKAKRQTDRTLLEVVRTSLGHAAWCNPGDVVAPPAVRAEKFPDLAWPDGTVPVIYMPGVSRQKLRAVEECLEALKPLVELQYRGKVWTHKNGKDWTVRAFLASDEGGLGLDVAEDRLTVQSMLGSLSQLAVKDVARLRSRRLEAEDFDKLTIGDTPRDLLLWMGDPEGTRDKWDDAKWSAFCNRCREEYDFDPQADGEIIGGVMGLPAVAEG